MDGKIKAFIENRLEELKDLECSTLDDQIKVVGAIEEYEWLLQQIKENKIDCPK